MNTYELALEKWGLESQLHQTQEECAELIASISHAIRGRQSFRAIAEEAADVEIMIEQLRAVIGPDIDRWKRIKLDRLAAHLGLPAPTAPRRPRSVLYICPGGCPDKVRVGSLTGVDDQTDDVLEIPCPSCKRRMIPAREVEW
jgi:hypothetical protein